MTQRVHLLLSNAVQVSHSLSSQMLQEIDLTQPEAHELQRLQVDTKRNSFESQLHRQVEVRPVPQMSSL